MIVLCLTGIYKSSITFRFSFLTLKKTGKYYKSFVGQENFYLLMKSWKESTQSLTDIHYNSSTNNYNESFWSYTIWLIGPRTYKHTCHNTSRSYYTITG